MPEEREIMGDAHMNRLQESRVDAALRMLGTGERTVKQVLQHLFAEGVQAGKDSQPVTEVAAVLWPDPVHNRYGVTNFSTFLSGGDHRVFELSGHGGGAQREVLRLQGPGSEMRAKMIAIALNAEVD